MTAPSPFQELRDLLDRWKSEMTPEQRARHYGWAAALAAAYEVAANAKRPPTPMAEGPLARVPEGVMRSHPTGESQ